jgi:hypothetical protein
MSLSAKVLERWREQAREAARAEVRFAALAHRLKVMIAATPDGLPAFSFGSDS